jgi:hypothetical protein
MPPQSNTNLPVLHLSNSTLESQENSSLELAGQAANYYAAKNVFMDYLSRRADNTIRSQAASLARFAEYLNEIGERIGQPLGASMSEWSISQRVWILGERIDLEGLSAHNCRHY